jgi:hypothetical protein
MQAHFRAHPVERSGEEMWRPSRPSACQMDAPPSDGGCASSPVPDPSGTAYPRAPPRVPSDSPDALSLECSALQCTALAMRTPVTVQLQPFSTLEKRQIRLCPAGHRYRSWLRHR